MAVVSTAAIPNRGLITLGVVLSTFMSALDTTVANISLPHMQGNLSASPEQITWVITSYIVAQAVTIPVSGWLAARFGIKAMLLGCIAAFTVTSVLCGLATNLPELVLFRMIQGAVAAPLMPLTQVVLFNINPPQRHGHAMAMFTLAAVVAPAIGPVIGGWLTENFTWRWCFFVNVPAGFAAMALISAFLPSTPVEQRRFDFLGFGALSVAVIAFQLMVDRGTTLDWFDSREVIIEALVAGSGFFVFVVHMLTAREPMCPPALLRDRNYVTAIIIGFFFSVMMFSSFTLMPLMMQGVLGYPVLYAGYVSTPRGLLMLVLLPFMGRLDAMVDRRILMAAGLGVLVLSFWQMAQFDLSMSGREIVGATLLQGLGQAMMFVPLSTFGFATIAQELRPEASSFSILIRNLGGSAGVAAIQAYTISNGQATHATLSAHVTADNPVLRSLTPGNFSPDTVQGALALNSEINRQAMMVAYVNDFWLLTIICALCIPLVLLMKTQRNTSDQAISAEIGHA